ncbi:hypothetical protein [Actinomarinicola tropica]|uniref:Uncharacterized protein n=1 Tax=Actinomarinicola tropica TaxID=2789776 RepID=A0A5Q2RJJ9_9ACTN|nr:hypothetical protein [Actinomarinicola tropica]QGG95072.1 hypothetical protein GH723_08105 [Actinomarinicola tropica]
MPDPAHRRCAVAATRVVAGGVLAAALVLGGPAAGAQTTTTTSDGTTTTANPLLVDGPAESAVADGATAQAADPAQDDGAVDGVADDDEVIEEDDEAEAKVRLVMFALIGVAVLLSGLTAYYWWYTSPGRQSASRGARSRPSAHRLERDAADGAPARRRRTASRSSDDDGGTVDPWPTDSTSTR